MNDIFGTNTENNNENDAIPTENTEELFGTPTGEVGASDTSDDEYAFLFNNNTSATPPEENGASQASAVSEPVAESNPAEDSVSEVSAAPLIEDAPSEDEEPPVEEQENDENGKKKNRGLKKILKLGAAYPVQVALYGLFKVFTWFINIMFTVVLVGIISAAVVVAAFIIYIQSSMDTSYTGLENLRFESAQETVITYTTDTGEEIKVDSFTGAENRSWASYDEIPADLINAYVAIEDKRYWEHPGVDYRRTANAVLNFFVSSGDRSGGSTITQQLIKNVSKNDDATIQRKVQEILRAMYVGQNYSKEEVLEMYLNTIFLSQNSYGVKAAAQTYFGKDLDELTLIECAALASIPKSPTKYDPLRNPYQNQLRRDLVLEEMLKQSLDEDGNFLPDAIITQEEYDMYHGAPLELNTNREEEYTETVHSYYMDALVDDVIKALCDTYGYDNATAARMLYSGGLTVVSNMDPLVQESMERVFEQTSNDYLYLKGESVPTTSGVIPQASMVVMDQRTGKVLGIVGGRGEKKENRGLNRATQSRRQCGSSIKPLSLYTLGIDAGVITYGSSVDDVPIMKNDDKYWPNNMPRRYYGMIDVNFAVIKSLNTVPVWLVDKLGVDTCYSFLTDTLGFTSLVDRMETGSGVFSDKALAPLALGGFTYGVTTIEMAQGYCMIANGGKTSEAQLFSEIRDNKGNILIKNTPKHKVAVSESSAYIMNSMLMNVISQEGATGTRVQMDEKYEVQVAGKTGSTNDDRDRYFVAYTPEYVGAVWFGYDNNKALSGFPYNPAISLWDRVFDNIYAGLKNANIEYTKEFAEPSGMVRVKYCAISGKLASDSCYRDIYYYNASKNSFSGNPVRTGVFARGTQPTEKCDCHIDVQYDRVSGGIFFDKVCSCPAANLVTVAFRLNEDRSFDSYVSVQDGDCIYKTIPDDYVFPTSASVPFFANLYPEGTYFGVNTKSPRNRVCTAHKKQQLPIIGPATGNESQEAAPQ